MQPTGHILSPREDSIAHAALLRGTVSPVYFDFDRSDVRIDQLAKLSAAKDYLDQHPEAVCILEGHCDWRGTAEYNLSLGDRRCVSVDKILTNMGIGSKRVAICSKGSEEANKSGGEREWAMDRRVEFLFESQTPQ